MTKFSEFFHVNQKNYFDVTLENDQTYFVDPVQIKGAKIENFNSTDAEASIKSFMNTAYDVVADRESPEAQNLLAPPHEINETRLGLTKRGSKGRGTSASILINVFSRIRGVPELKKSVLSNSQVLSLLTPSFGPDRFSDLITNIISYQLADFTSLTCKNIGMKDEYLCESQINGYNVEKQEWEPKTVILPRANDKGVILVPDIMVTKSYPYSVTKYIAQEILPAEQQKYMDKGENIKRKDLRARLLEAYDKDKEKSLAINYSLGHPDALIHYLSYNQKTAKKS